MLFAQLEKTMIKRLLCISLLLFSMLSAACSQEKVTKLRIGDQAPAFTLQDLEGKTMRLSDMKGSPVLLRFFLTDCKYCRADTPVFNDFYTRYHANGLQVLYIDSLGTNLKVVEAFVKELGILFPVAQDKGGAVSSSYMVRALPQTIVLDPDHNIIAAILGSVSEAELTQLLSPYFSEKS
ncbi:MAG: TlpA family protein disulfide reductase [Desulfobulbaceae bacterium]|nr:TlpA family protein disulfide reductase [Desulfobulbaceae bacterium]